MIKIFLISFLFLFQNQYSADKKIVGRVDSMLIYEDEFLSRLKKYIDNTGQKDNIILRKQILQNILNEKLILRDVFLKGFDNDSLSILNKKIISNQILINEFIKSVLLDTIKISDGEIYEEFKKSNTKVKVQYLFSDTFEGAMDIKKRVLDGESFEKIASEIFIDPELSRNGGTLGYISHGEMEKEFDEVAFNIEVGKISDPVKIKVGYAIIKVLDKVEVNLFSQFDLEKNRQNLSDKILENKIEETLSNYSNLVLKNIKINFEDEKIENIFNKYFNKNLSEEKKIDYHDSTIIANSLNGNVTKKYLFESFLIASKRQLSRINSSEKLKQYISGLIVRDEILRIANDKKISENPNIKNEIQSNINNYLLVRWKNLIEDEVSKEKISIDTLQKYYNANPTFSPPEVNVSEILLRDKNDIDIVKQELKSGVKFEKIASEKSIRNWTKNNNGILGFGNKEKYGKLFDTLYNSNKGKIIGPIFVDPYFAFFKIIEKKKPKKISFKDSENTIRLTLLKQKINKQFIWNLNELNLNSFSETDIEVLQNIELK